MIRRVLSRKKATLETALYPIDERAAEHQEAKKKKNKKRKKIKKKEKKERVSPLGWAVRV